MHKITIAIIFQIAGDIQNEIQKKQQKMSDMDLNMQTFIIVVAPNATEVEKVYICFDDTTYEPESLLRALHGLFQIYLIYNIPYPVESENSCYIIQWSLLNIRTPTDVQIPAVYNHINRLRKVKV